MTTESDKKPGPQWAHIELFGHRQIVGTMEDVIHHGIPFVAIRPLNIDGTLGDVEHKAPAAFYGDKVITEQRARFLAGCTDKLLPAPTPAPRPRGRTSGVDLIRRARETHESKGYDAEHDAEHTEGELARAAAVYAAPVEIFEKTDGEGGDIQAVWPWNTGDDHRPALTRVQQLAHAGALCAAEIDRLQAGMLDGELPCTGCGAAPGEPCTADCTAADENQI